MLQKNTEEPVTVAVGSQSWSIESRKSELDD